MRSPFFQLQSYRRVTRYSLIAVVFFGFLVFSLCYFFDLYFGITEIIAYLTGSVALLTLINFSNNIDLIQNHHLRTLEINRNQYSFNIIAESHKNDIANSFKIFRKLDLELDLSQLSIATLLNYLKKNPNDESEIIQLLNYFEHISLLIKWQHVDEEIIKDSFKTLFLKVYALSKNYINHVQSRNSSSVWTEFESLAIKWKQNQVY